MVDLRATSFWSGWHIAGALAVLASAACEQLPQGPAEAPGSGLRGMTLADWTSQGYASAQAQDEIRAIETTGANTLFVIVTTYQQGARANEIRLTDPRTPLTSAVEVAVNQAHSLGLDVYLKPHVDLENGWRGNIDPADPLEWFDRYRAFVRLWADSAARWNVRGFVVGTELARTVRHDEQWRRVIAEVRERFDGSVLYAASWDEAGQVPFWDAVDRVGVNAFFPIAGRANPGRTELLAGWQPWIERLSQLHSRSGKPIVFTEIGYRSVDGAGMHPYSFERTTRQRVDLAEQADLYWAALQATAPHEWIEGLVWWNWRARGGGGPFDDDFTPAGKPAAEELTATWGP